MAQQNTVGRVVTRADTRTPGPWRAAGLTIRDTDGAHIANILPYHYVDADGVTGVPIPDDEAQANARAIAELPALEEAARALVAYWEDDDSSEDQLDEAVATASAALARMDGGDDA